MGYTDPETGVFIDSRMHRRYESEAKLLGVVTTETGIMTAAPYKAVDTDHWVFAGHRSQGRRPLRRERACTSAAGAGRPGTRPTR